MVLVDTSVLINFLNRNTHKEAILYLLSSRQFCTCEIIIMEVLQGIKDEKKYEKIKFFMESLPLVSVVYQDYIKATEIYRGCRKKGVTIRKSVDCILAAVAIHNGLDLFSIDSDFDNIQKKFVLNRYYE